MRLLARQHGCLSAVLAALAGMCFAGCGYDFDAAFSDQAVAIEASAPDATEASADSAQADASSDVPSSDITVADVVGDSESGSEAATADVQPEASHCHDGKQNGDETGLDCGGSCDACAQELCSNHIDDDKDGKTDCEDESCGSYECVAAQGVTGWTGPVMVRSGAGCAAGETTLYSGGWGGLIAAPVCNGSTCTCGSPTGQDCSPPSVALHQTADCSDTTPGHLLVPNNCLPAQAADAFVVFAGTPTGGSCVPSGSSGTLAPLHWSVPTVVCGVGGGCQAGNVCSTAPASWGDDEFLCLVREGTYTCPSGWSPEPGLGLATTLPVGLACASCACDAPSGGSCPGQVVDLYQTMGCFYGTPEKFPALGECTPAGPLSGIEWTGPGGMPMGSSCTPSAPKVNGALKGSGFVTVCCLQGLP